MHPNPILHEVQQFCSVSDRLELDGGTTSLVSDALITTLESVRNTATLSEVMVAVKMASIPGVGPASA
jgi:hypothetical protein